MFQHILLVSFDMTGTIQCSGSYGIHMKITWFLFIFLFKKNQGRKYEKNNMLVAEPGRNIWGSHVVLSVTAEKQVMIVNSAM